jgi:hypothetical protein
VGALWQGSYRVAATDTARLNPLHDGTRRTTTRMSSRYTASFRGGAGEENEQLDRHDRLLNQVPPNTPKRSPISTLPRPRSSPPQIPDPRSQFTGPQQPSTDPRSPIPVHWTAAGLHSSQITDRSSLDRSRPPQIPDPRSQFTGPQQASADPRSPIPVHWTAAGLHRSQIPDPSSLDRSGPPPVQLIHIAKIPPGCYIVI